MDPITFHISHLIHPGTPSQPGEIGTADPAIWSHTIRHEGQTYSAILKSDITAHIPTWESLTIHLMQHPAMWVRVLNPETLPVIAL